jgi:hypothetical protein
MEGPFAKAKETSQLTISFVLSAVRTDTSQLGIHTLKPSKALHPSACVMKGRLSSRPPRKLYVSHTTSGGALQDTDTRSFMSVPSAVVNHTPSPQSPVEDIFQCIITPYNADAYNNFLAKFNLTTKYKDLTFNIHHGFPIGGMPPLSQTYTPKNHKSITECPDVILKYSSNEVKLRRMPGSYSKSEVQHILSGHFISLPLGLVEKSSELGKFRIV